MFFSSAARSTSEYIDAATNDTVKQIVQWLPQPINSDFFAPNFDLVASFLVVLAAIMATLTTKVIIHFYILYLYQFIFLKMLRKPFYMKISK